MRLLTAFLLMFNPLVSNSQDTSIVGKVDFAQLHGIIGWENMEKDFSAYQPESEKISYLKDKESRIEELTIFLGTWCSDSQEQFPKVWKVLQALDLDKKAILYGVNREKTEPKAEVEQFKVSKLPSVYVRFKTGEVIQILNEIPELNFETDFKIKTLHIN
jgi:thiol-disulfide isomerase/thioredoxin